MRAAVTARARHSFSTMRQTHDAPRAVKERETAALPINKRRNDRPLSESLMFEMDLSAGCKTILSSLPDVDEARIEQDLMGINADIEKRLILKTDFEKELMRAFNLVRCDCEESGQLQLEEVMEALLDRDFAVTLVGTRNHVKQTSNFCCCIVRHSFLLCFGKTENDDGEASYMTSTPVILDPHFRDQFDVQHPSVTYSAVMESVPDVYIGSYKRLEGLVRVLCCQMQKSFQAAQCALPPWRSVNSMLSRWADPIQRYKQEELCATRGCEDSFIF